MPLSNVSFVSRCAFFIDFDFQYSLCMCVVFVFACISSVVTALSHQQCSL